MGPWKGALRGKCSTMGTGTASMGLTWFAAMGPLMLVWALFVQGVRDAKGGRSADRGEGLPNGPPTSMGARVWGPASSLNVPWVPVARGGLAGAFLAMANRPSSMLMGLPTIEDTRALLALPS